MSIEEDTTTRSILVPLDASELAERALELASELARRTESELLIINVPEVYGFDPGWYAAAAAPGSPPLVPIDEMLAEARQDAQRYLDRQKEDLEKAGVTVGTVVGETSPAEAIATTAEAHRAWLIAMSTHGRGGAGRWAFGSVADKVLHISSLPILLVRSGAHHLDTRLDHIVVALDGSPLAEEALPHAGVVARAFRARVTLVNVTRDPERLSGPEALLAAERRHMEQMADYLSDVADRLAATGLDVTHATVAGEDVASALLKWGSENDVDVVAMTTHGRSGLRRWALGSVADRVLRTADTPVLLARVTDRPE